MGLDKVKLDLTIELEVDKSEHWTTEKVTLKFNSFDFRNIIQGEIQSEQALTKTIICTYFLIPKLQDFQKTGKHQ